MFLTAYVALILLAAFPLVRTLLIGGRASLSVVWLHRLYRDLSYVAAVVLVIICFETALTISLQNYWFGELGQAFRYWLALGLRLTIFFAILILLGIFVGYNLHVLCRPLPAVPKTAPWVAGFIFAAVVGFAATALWVPLLGYLGASLTGMTDPVLGKDLSFYLLSLPWYDAVVSILITVLVITLALWAVIGLGFYPTAGRPWNHPAFPFASGNHRLRVIDAEDAETWADSEAIWRRWLRQGLVLAGLFCIAMGLARFLGRYHLVIDGHSAVVAGGSYADVNFWIPAYELIMVCWFAAALLLMAAACLPRLRGWLLLRPSHWVLPCGLFAALYLAAVAVPPAVERVYVGPNQITLERPFL